MVDASTKLPVKTETKPAAVSAWQPLETLQREINRLFEDFSPPFWRSPFSRAGFDLSPLLRNAMTLATAPAVDIVEKESAYEVTAELPGMDEKNIEVLLVNGGLTIKGEKQEEKEEKKTDYFLQERHFGSFERHFGLPEGVDTDKIEANFKKGVLTLTLPKRPEARTPSKKIDIKAA